MGTHLVAVFTVVWYAFPGKFISFRGTTDFASRYSEVYVDPNDLLRQDYSQSTDTSENFDNADGLPIKEKTR